MIPNPILFHQDDPMPTFAFPLTSKLFRQTSTRKKFESCLFVFLLCLICVSSTDAQPASPSELLKNSGFEGGSGGDGRGGGVPRWAPFESGYDVDRKNQHGGDQCIRCDSVNSETLQGALCTVELNQKKPVPIFASGWSRADKVSGSSNPDYSLYVDLAYSDGSNLYGQLVSFRTGTHGWECRQILIFPTKPVKSMSVYALFRKHSGTVWFDDFSAHALDDGGIFDSQSLVLPARNGLAVKGDSLSLTGKDGLGLTLNGSGDIVQVKSGEKRINGDVSGGFYVRDVGADSPILPIRGQVRPNQQKGLTISSTPGLRLTASIKIIPEGDTLSIDGEINDVSKQNRAVTVYFALPVSAHSWIWGDDIRLSRKIDEKSEYANLTNVNVGAIGGMSLYPYACINNSETGLGIANQMDMPNVYRIFYNGPTHQFVIAWDFALAVKTGAWPSNNARFRCRLFRMPPGQAEWGFRAATKRFYQLNSPTSRDLQSRRGSGFPFRIPPKWNARRISQSHIMRAITASKRTMQPVFSAFDIQSR